MNDRFKFRVWSKQSNSYIKEKMFYIDRFGGLFKYEKSKSTVYINANSPYIMCLCGNNYIVEQCTGLKDKNGKLIYEGDIVKIIDKSTRKEPFIGVVEYTNTASFEANVNGFYMHLHNPKTTENVSMVEKMFCTSLREIEVVGNINENADLLKVDENGIKS